MKARKELSKNSIYFFVLFISLLCGVIVGSIAASLIDNDSATNLFSSLSVNNAVRSTEVFINSAFNILKYPILTFFLGFAPLGVAIIPVIIGIKGYFLAFAVGAIMKIYGTSGVLLSVSIFGFQALLLVPGLIVLATQCFSTAAVQARILLRRQPSIAGSVFSKKFFLISGACFFTFISLILIEFFITPYLTSYAFSSL